MTRVVISGSAVNTPEESISNAELVQSFNAYVNTYNDEHRMEIEMGEVAELQESSAEFIEKASGIKSRFVIDKKSILDPNVMQPVLADRPDDELSVMAEFLVGVAKDAMAEAGKAASDIDLVISAGSNMQRPYPAIAIEVQNELGIRGFGFDMNVACSSVTIALQLAHHTIRNGGAKCILLVNPELASPQVNFRDRDSHFIFGDAVTAMVIETSGTATSNSQFEIIDTTAATEFSNNIRSNFGYMNRIFNRPDTDMSNLFKQEGRKVFKEVVPMVQTLIASHLSANRIEATDVKRYFLHQANQSMNGLIIKKLLGVDEVDHERAPLILDRYANTASAGCVISFHTHKSEIDSGELAVLCSFGAGYSVGSVILKRV